MDASTPQRATTEWRFLRGWTEAELSARLAAARLRPRNFDLADERTLARGWSHHHSRAIVAREPAGPPVPDGPFERAWPLLTGYAFSDPRIVEAHFDGKDPLAGRVMLLEAKVLGLRYLGAVVVGDVQHDGDDRHTVRGFRYDTLRGHLERGVEWFVIGKEHDSGAVTLTIHAEWRPGDLPNFWSRWGFRLLGQRYQRAWHRLAHLRMRALLGSAALDPVPRGTRLVRSGPPVPLVPVQQAARGRPPSPITVEDDAPGRVAEVS